MKVNRKGMVKVEYILITIGIIAFLVMLLSPMVLNGKHEKDINQDFALLENKMSEYIKDVEDAKHLTLSIEASIERDFSDKFFDLEIKGTDKKVNTGEEVVLIVKAVLNNSGDIKKKTFVEHGIAN